MLFSEASVWADDLRREARRTTSGITDITHPDWHYVNQRIGAKFSADRGGQLDVQIDEQLARLADISRSEDSRAIALTWLIHLVSDAHQPLHVASWPLADGGFDDGGLAYMIRDPANPKRELMSLHSWWDNLPGPPWLRGAPLLERAASLRTGYGEIPVTQRLPADWLEESFVLARDEVRPNSPSDHLPLEITSTYRNWATNTAKRRIVESGVRLGRLLDSVLRSSTAKLSKSAAGNVDRAATESPPESHVR